MTLTPPIVEQSRERPSVEPGEVRVNFTADVITLSPRDRIICTAFFDTFDPGDTNAATNLPELHFNWSQEIDIECK